MNAVKLSNTLSSCKEGARKSITTSKPYASDAIRTPPLREGCEKCLNDARSSRGI